MTKRFLKIFSSAFFYFLLPAYIHIQNRGKNSQLTQLLDMICPFEGRLKRSRKKVSHNKIDENISKVCCGCEPSFSRSSTCTLKLEWNSPNPETSKSKKQVDAWTLGSDPRSFFGSRCLWPNLKLSLGHFSGQSWISTWQPETPSLIVCIFFRSSMPRFRSVQADN